MGQRFDSLDRLSALPRSWGPTPRAATAPEIRDQVIAGLGRSTCEFASSAMSALCVRWVSIRPLERYAFCEPSGEMVISRLDDGRELSRLSVPGRRDNSTALGAGFSPDGGLLVTTDQSPSAKAGIVMRIWNWSAESCSRNWRVPIAWRLTMMDATWLSRAPERGVSVWDRNERRVVRRLPLDFPPGQIAFDPEGRRLAVANLDRAAPRVVILEARTGQVLADWRTQVGNQSPSWRRGRATAGCRRRWG